MTKTSGSGSGRLGTIDAHLYSALNNGDMDDVAHEHVARAYKLLDGIDIETETNVGESAFPPNDNPVHGSFIAKDLFPNREELASRVKHHASQRFEHDEMDTSPNTWEIVWVGLEDGVVLYRVKHDVVGEPEVAKV